MRINTNIDALNGQRNLAMVSFDFSKSVEKLSSGLRINRAGDDAAGLTISEKLRAQVRGLNQAERNAQDGISLIQTAEGGLNEIHSILQRMRELAVQAASDTLQDSDRDAIGSELDALRNEINRIATTTQFNGKTLLAGSLNTTVNTATSGLLEGELLTKSKVAVSKVDVTGATGSNTYSLGFSGSTVTMTNVSTGVSQTLTATAMTSTTTASQVLNFSSLGVKITLSGFDATNGTAANIADDMGGQANIRTGANGSAQLQIGANQGQTMNISVSDAQSTAVGAAGGYASLSAAVTAAATVGAFTTTVAGNLLLSVDAAITNVSNARSSLGAYQNRLEHTIANLSVSSENLSASESRIRDVDMAAETVRFTRAQILKQAGTSVLAQANSAPQSVLALLRG
jgi:flagellin